MKVTIEDLLDPANIAVNMFRQDFSDYFVLNQWIPALRSKKYTQTKGFLHTEKGFCCLGVGCDIIEPIWDDETTSDNGDTVFAWKGHWRMSSEDFRYHAGLKGLDGHFVLRKPSVETYLTDMNDGKGHHIGKPLTFDQIADVIELHAKEMLKTRGQQ